MTKRCAQISLFLAWGVILAALIFAGSESTTVQLYDRDDQQTPVNAGVDEVETAPIQRQNRRDTLFSQWREGDSPLRSRRLLHSSEHQSYRELTPELLDECLEIAAEIFPSMAKSLQAQREKDSSGLERQIRRRAAWLLPLVELKHRDPDLYELKLFELKADAQINAIAQHLRQALADGNTVEAEQLEEQLRALLRFQGVLLLRSRDDYICRLQEHIEQLQEQLQIDRDNFDEQIEQRIQVLIQHDGPRRGPMNPMRPHPSRSFVP